MSDRSSPEPTERLDALGGVIELGLLLDHDMTETLGAVGLTKSRAPLIWALAHSGPTTQRTLADTLGVSARNVTELVDALETTGFVTREPHPSDRRATLVTLTQRGVEIGEWFASSQQDFADLLFADMTAAQFTGFRDGLDHILGKLRTHLAAGQGAARAEPDTGPSRGGGHG